MGGTYTGFTGHFAGMVATSRTPQATEDHVTATAARPAPLDANRDHLRGENLKKPGHGFAAFSLDFRAQACSVDRMPTRRRRPQLKARVLASVNVFYVSSGGTKLGTERSDLRIEHRAAAG